MPAFRLHGSTADKFPHLCVHAIERKQKDFVVIFEHFDYI